MTDDLSPIEMKRQLISLEDRLEKALARSKTVTSERDNLKRRLATAEKKIDQLTAREDEAQEKLKAAEIRADELVSNANKKAQEVEDENQVLLKQLNSIIVENRSLAERLQTTTEDLTKFQEVALGTEDAIHQAREETEKKMRVEFTQIEETFKVEQKRLRSQIMDLERQIKEQGKLLYLPPERVADLVNTLVSQLQDGMYGMKLKAGEIKLKVGFSGVGEHVGFVVPTPDSGPELKDNLHEVTIRFDQVSRNLSK